MRSNGVSLLLWDSYPPNERNALKQKINGKYVGNKKGYCATFANNWISCNGLLTCLDWRRSG